MLADFCKHRFLLSLSPAIPPQCGGVHKMKGTTQPDRNVAGFIK